MILKSNRDVKINIFNGILRHFLMGYAPELWASDMADLQEKGPA